MRILLIILVAVGIIYFASSRIATSMAEREKPVLLRGQEPSSVDGVSTDIPALTPEPSKVVVPNNSITPLRPQSSTVFFTHQFKHRLAPRIPGFLEDKDGVGIALDDATNTWIIEVDESQAPHIRKVVEMLDIAPDELDLDFVLLAVSEKWLRSIGVDVTFQEGASYLSSVGIFDTSGGLRFASGSLRIDISGESSNEHVSVYRTPVVRILEGEQWKISEVIETPIPVTQTVDGVATTTVQYTSLGLELLGKCSKGTRGWRLDLEQSNGTKGADVNLNSFTVPERRTQSLKTAVYLEPNKWTVCGGVRNIESTTKSGLLFKRKGFSRDLILIFCRPRTSLRKVYKALPPFSKPGSVRDTDSILPLPSKK